MQGNRTVRDILLEELASIEQPITRYELKNRVESKLKKERKKLPHTRSYIYDLLHDLEKDGNITVDKKVWRQGVKRSIERGICHLSFKGVVIYLSTIPEPKPPIYIGYSGETLKEIQKKVGIMRNAYINDVQRLVKITENHGRMLGYSIFDECKFLMKHLGEGIFLHWLLDLSKMVITSTPILVNVSRHADLLKRQEHKTMKEMQTTPNMTFDIFHENSNGKMERTEYHPKKIMKEEIEHMNKWLKAIRTKEDELWRHFFAQYFFERLAMISDRKMPNEKLHELATFVLKKNMQTIKNLEVAINLFKAQ